MLISAETSFFSSYHSFGVGLAGRLISGVRSMIRSRFRSWKKLSATALSGQVPRLLMLASRLCLPGNECHSSLVNCDPRSERIITLAFTRSQPRSFLSMAI